MKLPRDLTVVASITSRSPNHDPLRPGTLSAILRDVGHHADLPGKELLRLLFG